MFAAPESTYCFFESDKNAPGGSYPRRAEYLDSLPLTSMTFGLADMCISRTCSVGEVLNLAGLV